MQVHLMSDLTLLCERLFAIVLWMNAATRLHGSLAFKQVELKLLLLADGFPLASTLKVQ